MPSALYTNGIEIELNQQGMRMRGTGFSDSLRLYYIKVCNVVRG
jgi:hypothetical protein